MSADMNFVTSDVMQSYEDSLVAEILRVFPDYEVFVGQVRERLPRRAVVVVIKQAYLQRASVDVQRRTLITDIAVVSPESDNWVNNRFAEIKSIKLGNVEKIIKDGRFNIVDGINHMSFTTYLSEIS